MTDWLYIALAGFLLAAVHVLSPWLTFLDTVPRSRWLSFAGGISTAYVFVHLMPELAHLQGESGATFWQAETELFLVALAGLATFYGLERWAKSHAAAADRTREMPVESFRLHVGSFAVYNMIVGYVLPERLADGGLSELAFYTLAMVLHFVVNDRGLYAEHGARYLAFGRWVLAGAAVLGALLGLVVELPEIVIALLIAFLGGGVILNVLKEELPEERESRFWAFAAGAAIYAALLHLA